MLKITESKALKQITTLRLEGHVVGPWVDELEQVCEPLTRSGRQLALDLTDVAFVDARGIAALTGLSAQGTRLLNASPFVEEQLKAG